MCELGAVKPGSNNDVPSFAKRLGDGAGFMVLDLKRNDRSGFNIEWRPKHTYAGDIEKASFRVLRKGFFVVANCCIRTLRYRMRA